MVVFGNSLINSANGILLITSPLSASFPVTLGSLASALSSEAIVDWTQSLNQTLRFGSEQLRTSRCIHRNEEKDEHDIAVELRKVVSSTNTVTVLNLTSMYAPRVRHNLNKGTVKRGGNNQIHHRLLERRDEHLNEIEWSGIHEFVWRPDQPNGLGPQRMSKTPPQRPRQSDEKNVAQRATVR
jgi:hypothetical protein